MLKFELLIGGLRYNIHDDLKNWDKIEATLKRSDYGGVVRSYANDFEFVGDARLLLKKEYLTNYLNSKAVIVISVMNSELTWNEKYRNDLDFFSYRDDGNVLTMNAIDNSLASLIKANKSQVYDLPVRELMGPIGAYLMYDRIELRNSASWFVSFPTDDTNLQSGIYKITTPIQYTLNFPLAYGETNFPVKNKIEVLDVTYNYQNRNKDPLVRAIENCDATIKVGFDIQMLIHPIGDYEESIPKDVIFIIEHLSETNQSKSKSETTITKSNVENNDVIHIEKEVSFSLKEKDYISVYFSCRMPINVDITISNFESFSVDYIGRNPMINVSIFSPGALLSRLLYSMTGRDIEYELTFPNEFYTVVMAAAESIRGIPGAKVHTSFSKFVKWMEAVFGYTYKIEGEKVKFMSRDSLFSESEVRMLDNISTVEVSLDSKLIYSGVEVGYEKKDYDEINGRDEFHVKNSFTTGVGGTDNILSLISPYRADPYGFEFLAQKREETKDNDSDNDLFFLQVRSNTSPFPANSYRLTRTLSVTGVLTNSIFNAVFSPRKMLLNNKRFIGACTNKLTFTASEGNADVFINGVSEKEEILIEDPLFRVEEIKINTVGLAQFPDNGDILIGVESDGMTYSGYIKEISINMGKRAATTYALMCKDISEIH